MLVLMVVGTYSKRSSLLEHTRQVVANTMDGVVECIPDHFRTIYSGLYNSVEDTENMTRLSSEVELRVGDFSLQDVAKVTPDLVKEATSKLRAGKTDPVFNFSSDCIN